MKKEKMSSKKSTYGIPMAQHKILTNCEQRTHLIQIASENAMRYAQKRSASVQKCQQIFYFQIWNHPSPREWDFTAQMIMWYCVFARPRGNTGFSLWQAAFGSICGKKRVVSGYSS